MAAAGADTPRDIDAPLLPGSTEKSQQVWLARLRGFEPGAAGPLFAFEPEPYRPQVLDARIRFAAARNSVANP